MTEPLQGVIFDYTTIVGAANVISAEGVVYPGSTRNPYEALLQGRPTSPDAPMWLEVAALSDVVESIVIHDKLLLLGIGQGDRNFESGRYSSDISGFVSLLDRGGATERVHLDTELERYCDDLLTTIADNQEFLLALIETYFALLKQPVYEQIPDLFSHSQTVYKFDGEAVWQRLEQRLEQRLPLSKFTRQFQKAALRSGFEPSLRWTSHYYPAEILSFLIRGIVYDSLAYHHACPYHPHSARAPVVMASGLWAGTAASDLAGITIDYVKKVRKSVVTQANARLDATIFDVSLPPIFATVLKQAQRPRDILPIALGMRDTRSARAYRDWLRMIGSGEGGNDLVKATSQLESLGENLALELGLAHEEIDVKLGIVSMKRRLPSWLHREMPSLGRPHVQFLRNLARDAIAAVSLEKQLIRVFRQ